VGRKKAEEHAHSESWLVSYCDMISLLVTFFLMMMTFSSSEKGDVREAGVGILAARGGIWKNPIMFPEQVDVDPQVVSAIARDLGALVGGDGETQTSSVKPIIDGFTIGFDLDASFAPGSAEPTAALRANVIKLGAILERYDRLIVFEGFTDDKFEPSVQYPTETAVSIARARAGARILLENSLVPPDRVQIAGIGKLRPRAPNETALGRHSNRRVEVRVVSLAKPRPLGG
jgi:chemotaxis protein MotB